MELETRLQRPRFQGKVAIVHPDQTVVIGLKNLLGSFGLEFKVLQVTHESTPQEVALFVSDYGPRLLFLAENYTPKPLGQGVEALIEIRKTRSKDRLPILIVSGGPSHRERAMQEGADGYYEPLGKRNHLDYMGSILREYF